MSIHPLRLIATIALLSLLAGTAATASERVTGRIAFEKLSWSDVASLDGGPEKISRELTRQRLYHERWHQIHDLLGDQHISARSQRWLSERGLGLARSRAPLADAGLKAGADTLRILLVRISFETNREPSLVTMAPDGDFFLGQPDPDDPLPIDPPPHDRAFFEAHLEGLREYYSFQSGGRLHIDARVLPEGDTDSYKLSDVADYGPGADSFWTIAGLESLVRDMITTADAGAAADGVSLADYDDDDDRTYIIFAHAGSDWQSDINRDSPNDIPTFFVTLGEAQALASVDSETGLPGSLRECSVIPETTNQDGYKGSIAAALYHEFGHALGLPDVYDATSGYTACGVWDLMDSGTNLAVNIGVEQADGQVVSEVVTGVLPPSLSAWCKWFLGWVTTDEVTGGQPREVKLPAVGVPRVQYGFHNEVQGNRFSLDDPQVLLGGASGGEFFLVENRWVPFSVADTPYDIEDDLYFVEDRPTGVILYLGGTVDGVRNHNTGYYDYFLPDGGLLIWHANMDRIEASLATNSINEFGDGLRLVEADGIQDIGVLNAYVLGWYGSASDVFAPWNTGGFNELFAAGAGVPTSRGFDGALTGLRLTQIEDDGGARGAVMRLQATLDGVADGWPVQLPASGPPRNPDPRALIPASLTAVPWPDGRDLLFAASDTTPSSGALLFAWTAGGEPAFGPVGGLPAGAVLDLPAPLASPPVLLEAGQATSLALGTADGTVWRLRAGAGSQPEVAWSTVVDDTLLAGPVPLPLDDGSPGRWPAAVVDGQGQGLVVDADGALVGEPLMLLGPEAGVPVAPLVVLPGASGRALLLVASPVNFQLVEVDAGGFTGERVDHLVRLHGRVRTATLPMQDGQRLILFDDTGLVGSWLVTPTGDLVTLAWPDLAQALVGEPAVADLDGDGRLDVIAATADRILAWDDRGTSLRGYPRRLDDLAPLGAGNVFAGGPVVADLVGGPANELACLTEAGHLFLLGQDALPLTGSPLRCSSGPGSLLVVPHDGRLSLAVADRGGERGEPLQTRLTHGRVVLVGDHDVAAGTSAGWYGPGGGSSRLGPVGTAQAVTDDPSLLAASSADVVFYPSPITGRTVVVRFFNAVAGDAELAIYNLAGEPVLTTRLRAEAERTSEHTLDLDVASGLYVARLIHEPAAGARATVVKTLAVVR